MLQKEVVPDVRAKMGRKPNPRQWWRPQDLAPPHEKMDVEDAIAQLAANVSPRFLKGADVSPLDIIIWDW